MNCLLLLVVWLGIAPEPCNAEERLIAVIMANSQPRYQEIHAAFVKSSQGVCADNCRIYVQTPNADIMSLRNGVRKAVALGADLIVTYGPAASLAAKAEALKKPVLFVDVYDPVALELVSAKHQTGRNMTGIRGDAPVQTLFKYFLEATQARKLVVLYDINSPEGTLQKLALEESGKKKGVEIISLSVEGAKDHLTPLQSLPSDIDGIFLANSEHDGSQLSEVLAFARERRLPVITQRPGGADMGAFMALETSADEQGEKLAEMAGKVLSGTATDELTMYKPRQIAFVVNLKVAKELDLSVPFQTLSVTSRVVR